MLIPAGERAWCDSQESSHLIQDVTGALKLISAASFLPYTLYTYTKCVSKYTYWTIENACNSLPVAG